MSIARPIIITHIHPMADRTCKPDADFKLLWRTLLPGTPFPACGTVQDTGAPSGGDGEAAESSLSVMESNRNRADRR